MFTSVNGKLVPLTADQNFLRMTENRINGLKINDPNHPELARVEAARQDIIDRMGSEQHGLYVKLVTAELTPAEKRAAAEREKAAMEANRDKPSI